MTLSRRTFLTAAGGLAAAASLAACGSNTGRPADTAGSSGGASGGPKPSLSYWTHEYGEQGVQDAIKKYLKAYDKADVTLKWNPSDYDKLVSSALLTNDVPDAFEFANGPTLDMIKAGQVVDLTDVVSAAKADFNQPVLKRLTFQDKIWAIPQCVDMQLLYYRKSILDKAGVKPPTTFDELVDAANKVKTGKMGGFFAGNDGGLSVLGNMFIWAAGFQQLNSARTEIGFNDPAFFDALVKYRDFFKSGGLLQSASADWSSAAAFKNEETAMQWGGLWSLPEIKDAFKDDFGVVAFPKFGSNGKQAVPFGAYSACVAAKSKNVDAAKQFVKWLWVDKEDYQTEFSTGFGAHIPAKPKLSSKISDANWKAAATMVESQGQTTDILWTDGTSNAYTTMLTNVIKKGADPSSEIQAVADKAKAEIKRVNG